MAKRKRKRKKLKREDVQKLKSMGFSEEIAKAALLENSNVEEALNDLLNESEERESPSYLAPKPKRSRTNSPIAPRRDLPCNKEEENNFKREEKKEDCPATPTAFSQEKKIDRAISVAQTDNLLQKYETFKERYEKDRSHLCGEQSKIDEKIKLLRPHSERFDLVRNSENWSKKDASTVIWLKKQWVEEQEVINTELKKYENHYDMFDDQLKYIDHMFQKRTIQFENEKTVAKLISNDIKSGQRMSADDRNLFLLSSAQRKLQDKYNCTICFCEYEIKDFAFLRCMHGFCRSCLEMMITTKVKEGKLQNLYCPNIDDEGSNCKHQLTHEEVRLFIGQQDLFNKYERLQLQQTLNQTEDCRWCPRPGCETAMFGDKSTPMMTCPKCEMKFCFNCKTSEWHPGTTCEMFQKWKMENSQADAKFENWKNKNTAPCPKCKSNIEKNGGCMHMTCLNCKHEFHWLTGEKWRGYNARYEEPWEENPQPQNDHAADHNILNNGVARLYRRLINRLVVQIGGNPNH